jgi:cation:H+ antiporter
MAPVVVALPAFLISLAITLRAAERFAERLDRLGTRYGFSEALVGLLTAVAADGPEISSALIALAKGAHATSVGVLVGSNVFNLAAMIGVSALVAGSVHLPRASLALEGSAGLAITLIGAAVLLALVTPALGAVLAVIVLAPYLLVVVGGSRPLARVNARLKLRGRAVAMISGALEERGRVPAPRAGAAARPRREIVLIVLEVILIAVGSFGMVEGALSLGDRWGISGAVIGVLILAPLTSIPNAATAIRLGRQDRGSALLTEALNSNTINLVIGVVLPALFVGLTSLGTTGRVNVAWMVGMTVISLALLARPRGIGRAGGALLVALYAGFVVTQLALS